MCVCVCVCVERAQPIPPFSLHAMVYPFPPQVVAQPTATQVRIIEKKPDNYIFLSVFTLLCCCWLFGLIALIYALQVSSSCSLVRAVLEDTPHCPPLPPLSLQVDSAYSNGDRAGASSASRSAKTWNIVGIIWGSVSIALIVIVNVIWIPVVLVADANDYTPYD